MKNTMKPTIAAVKIYYPASILNPKLPKMPFIELSNRTFLTTLYPLKRSTACNPDLEIVLDKHPKIVELNFIVDDNAAWSLNEGSTNFSTIRSSNIFSLESFTQHVMHQIFPKLTDQEKFTTSLRSLLTPRELEILKHVYDGLSNKQIASKINLSPRTIELHRQNSSAKLGSLSPQTLQHFFSDSILKMYSCFPPSPKDYSK